MPNNQSMELDAAVDTVVVLSVFMQAHPYLCKPIHQTLYLLACLLTPYPSASPNHHHTHTLLGYFNLEVFVYLPALPDPAWQVGQVHEVGSSKDGFPALSSSSVRSSFVPQLITATQMRACSHLQSCQGVPTSSGWPALAEVHRSSKLNSKFNKLN